MLVTFIVDRRVPAVASLAVRQEFLSGASECWQPALRECRQSWTMKEGVEVVGIALLSSSGMLVALVPPKSPTINYAVSVAIVASRQGSGCAGRLRQAKPSLR